MMSLALNNWALIYKLVLYLAVCQQDHRMLQNTRTNRKVLITHADLQLHCPLSESHNTKYYMDEQQRSRDTNANKITEYGRTYVCTNRKGMRICDFAELMAKYYVCLKTLLQKSLSEPVFLST